MLRFKVEGMTCGHCVQTVENAIAKVAPGSQVVVDLPSGEVTVQGDIDGFQIYEAITEAGYEVRQE